MEYTVYISKPSLDYFRSKARNCPLEIHAYLIGEIKYPNIYIVTSVEHSQHPAEQTNDGVTPSWEDWSTVNSKADKERRRIIGDVHSHPEAGLFMSPADYEACVADGTEICGIVSVRGRKTQVMFWHVNSALPCKVRYADYRSEEGST